MRVLERFPNIVSKLKFLGFLKLLEVMRRKRRKRERKRGRGRNDILLEPISSRSDMESSLCDLTVKSGSTGTYIRGIFQGHCQGDGVV
mmetsp:Transcript_6779/g.12765  ORF Transcript_6779/g.12765 Transcript_6779/m.12765 type:complete len:88 (+) Transcript_6779:24-287(+)